MLTLRGWGLVSASLGGLLVAVFTLNLIPIAIAVFLVVFVCAELLFFGRVTRTVRASAFSFERTDMTSRVATGGLGVVRLEVRHPTPIPFLAEIYDSLPEVLEVVEGSSHLTTWWSDGQTLSLSYVFRAWARGVYTVGPTEVRLHDALGLAFHRVVLNTEGRVHVAPTAPEVALRRSSVRVSSRPSGLTPVSRRGYGTEFRSLRPYLPSDDYKAIAWRRSLPDRLYVREFEQESRQDFLVVISVGREMGAGRLSDTALDRACEAGMLLTQYVPRGGDRIGLLLWGEGGSTFLPPGRGALHTLRLTEALTEASSAGPTPELPALLARLPAQLSQPTHVFAFAPLPGQPERALPPLTTFRAAGHRLYLFPPDLAEMYPAFSDPTRQMLLERAEGAERRRAHGVRSVLERFGIPVYSYDRQGASAHLLALYQQIHTWGVAR